MNESPSSRDVDANDDAEEVSSGVHDINIGDIFHSFDEFLSKLYKYQRDTKSVYACMDSTLIKRDFKVNNPQLKYRFVKYVCHKYTRYRKKLNKAVTSTGCPCFFRVIVNSERTALVVRDAVKKHNHPTLDDIDQHRQIAAAKSSLQRNRKRIRMAHETAQAPSSEDVEETLLVQASERDEASRRTGSDLAVGDKFRSFDEFLWALEAYQEENKVVYTRADCRLVGSRRVVNPGVEYVYVKYTCKHRCKRKQSKSTGQRPNRKTYHTNCPSFFRAALNKDQTHLVLVDAMKDHNHPVNDEIYALYPETRRKFLLEREQWWESRRIGPRRKGMKKQPLVSSDVCHSPESDHGHSGDSHIPRDTTPGPRETTPGPTDTTPTPRNTTPSRNGATAGSSVTTVGPSTSVRVRTKSLTPRRQKKPSRHSRTLQEGINMGDGREKVPFLSSAEWSSMTRFLLESVSRSSDVQCDDLLDIISTHHPCGDDCDALLMILYGPRIYRKWKELKEKLGIESHAKFIQWVDSFLPSDVAGVTASQSAGERDVGVDDDDKMYEYVELPDYNVVVRLSEGGIKVKQPRNCNTDSSRETEENLEQVLAECDVRSEIKQEPDITTNLESHAAPDADTFSGPSLEAGANQFTPVFGDEQNRKKFMCQLCQFVTVHEDLLTNHIRDEHGNLGQYRLQYGGLPLCGKTRFSNRNCCTPATIDPVTRICARCGRLPTKPVEERSFMCEQCGKCFNSQHNLRLHIHHRHLGKRDFPCTEPGCRYATFHKADLLQHQINKHRKRSEYMCSHCGKYFSIKSRLFAHEKTHENKVVRTETVKKKKANDKLLKLSMRTKKLRKRYWL